MGPPLLRQQAVGALDHKTGSHRAADGRHKGRLHQRLRPQVVVVPLPFVELPVPVPDEGVLAVEDEEHDDGVVNMVNEEVVVYDRGLKEAPPSEGRSLANPLEPVLKIFSARNLHMPAGYAAVGA